MIDDFIGADATRRKPKRIEPLEKPTTKPLDQLVAEHDSAEAEVASSAPTSPQEEPPEPAFVPPDQVADETIDLSQEATEDDSNTAVTREPKHTNRFFSPHWTIGKKWTVILAAFSVLLIGGGAAFAFLSQPKNQGGTFVSVKPKYVPKDTRVPSTLTGMLVDSSVNLRPVTGVMIENSKEARPQSGLEQAGIVYEAIAEGGITRFLALFQDTESDYIGPVRSVRPYYVQWCMSYDCALAHAGGSPEALQNIRAWGTKDLDQFANSAPYQRVSGRYAPHNLYTSTSKLRALEDAKGFGAPTYTGFARKKESPSKTPNALNINLAISSAAYNARFEYDAKSNSYKRSQGGAAHMTVNATGSQAQISPKVVVALITAYGVAADRHSQYSVVGSGQAFIFQDGTVTQVNWSKADISAPLRLTDAAGQDSKLNAGQTWVTALSAANLVTYQ